MNFKSSSMCPEKMSTFKAKTLSFGGFLGKKVTSAGNMSIPSASTVLAAAKAATAEAANLLMTEVPSLITEAKQVRCLLPALRTCASVGLVKPDVHCVRVGSQD